MGEKSVHLSLSSFRASGVADICLQTPIFGICFPILDVEVLEDAAFFYARAPDSPLATQCPWRPAFLEIDRRKVARDAKLG